MASISDAHLPLGRPAIILQEPGRVSDSRSAAPVCANIFYLVLCGARCKCTSVAGTCMVLVELYFCTLFGDDLGSHSYKGRPWTCRSYVDGFEEFGLDGAGVAGANFRDGFYARASTYLCRHRGREAVVPFGGQCVPCQHLPGVPRMLSSGLLHWGALAMAITLAYTAWYSRRNGGSSRDTTALRVCSAISFVLSAMLAILAHWASD